MILNINSFPTALTLEIILAYYFVAHSRSPPSQERVVRPPVHRRGGLSGLLPLLRLLLRPLRLAQPGLRLLAEALGLRGLPLGPLKIVGQGGDPPPEAALRRRGDRIWNGLKVMKACLVEHI